MNYEAANISSLFILRTGFSVQSFLSLNYSLEFLHPRKETTGNGGDSKPSLARLPAFSTKLLSTPVVSPACKCVHRQDHKRSTGIDFRHLTSKVIGTHQLSQGCVKTLLDWGTLANNRLNVRAPLWKFMKIFQGNETLSSESSPLR